MPLSLETLPLDLALMLAGGTVLAGIAAGLLAGLLGVGGGIVIVPVLFHIFSMVGMPLDLGMPLAVGTSLATIIVTSLASMRAHHRRGAVDWPLLRRWAPWIALGVCFGTLIAGIVSGVVLTAVFATVALAVALHMALSPDGLRLGPQLPDGAGLGGLGIGIGGFSVMMGIGGGTLSVPTMVLFSYPIHRAVGTASAIGLIIAVPGTLGFALAGWGAPGLPPGSLGFVNLIGFAIIVPATVLAAPLGARLAHAIDKTLLRRAFALFLALTSARMVWSLLG